MLSSPTSYSEQGQLRDQIRLLSFIRGDPEVTETVGPLWYPAPLTVSPHCKKLLHIHSLKYPLQFVPDVLPACVPVENLTLSP